MQVPVAVTLADLADDPHPVLARLRAAGPVAWVPALNAWLVTGYHVAVDVLRDPGTFTVDDPRFSTARVVGPSMLSLDGAAHARHRGPFTRPFRTAPERLAPFIQAEADRLVSAIAPSGEGELRRAVAGPLAVTVMAEVLGLAGIEPAVILGWYDAIVAATSAGGDDRARHASGELGGALRAAMAAPGLLREVTGQLTEREAVSNAAVLMFGGIETTEGMIANALLHLLANPDQLALVRAGQDLIPAAIEESLRLEPAAAVVDRYATADTELAGTPVSAGDQVTVSISGANRDPAVFGDPDRYRVRRANAARHLAFAHGPHFCLGAHLARLETRIAVAAVLTRLTGLRLAGGSGPAGLIFRKPPDLRVRWEPDRGSVIP
jgi:cytochrome P450